MDEVDFKTTNRQYKSMSPITTQISVKSDSYGSGKIYINEPKSLSSKLSINSSNGSPYLGKVYINQDYSSVDKISINFENESTNSDKISLKSENVSNYTTDSAVDISSNKIKVIHKVYDDERDDILSSKSDILSDVLSGNSDSTRNIDSRSVSPSTRNESRNSDVSRSLSPVARNESRNSDVSRSLSPVVRTESRNSKASGSMSPDGRNESRNSEEIISNDEDGRSNIVIKCTSPIPDGSEHPKRTMDDFRRELVNRPGEMSSLPRDLFPKRNPFIRGSDPRVATCRGKLQNRRSQLNQEINKELRLRAGAENLFKATHNRKLRETVALELSFVNSNLQLLKEQLASLNSSVELYQNDSKDSVMPMVPLGLKETKEVDFREPFTDFILEHYSEEATEYQEAISDFMNMRQAVRTPVRNSSGVALLFRYYNQLYFIERRFFPPDRSLGIYFEWFDSLTGVPSCQRTVAFEKACILFNMAAIYTQIGAKQDRSVSKGLDSAVDSLLRAAGMLRYIHENFTNAPSMDLSPDMLDMLVSLMLCQARECLFEKLVLGAQEECAARERELCDDLPLCLDLCQESQTLAHQYQLLRQKLQAETVMSYVPYSWVSLVNIKTEFYKALSHHHIATGLLNATTTRTSSNKTQERLTSVSPIEPNLPPWCDFATKDRNVDGSPVRNGDLLNGSLASREEQKIALGKAHLSEALNYYEEALRLQRMCRELKSKASLSRVLRMHQDKAVNQSALLPDGPDFADLIDPPIITASTKFQLSLTQPDFAQHRVEDLFKSLGPVAIFSAKRHWSAPRLVQLQKSHVNGRSIRSDKQRDVKRGDRGRINTKQYADDEYRNGGKVMRNISLYEKRDRSEDNSSYYYQRDIIKSDEKYKLQRDESKYDRHNSKTPLSRQNGSYANGYNNNNNNIEKFNGNLTRHENDLVAKYNEKNLSTTDLKYVKDGNNRIRIKNDSFKNGTDVNGKIAYFQKNGVENFSYGLKQNGGDLKNNSENLIRRISSECNLNSSDEVDGENGHDRTGDGFGFSVRGDAPVIIASVEPRSLADLGGMREGDFIVAIGDSDVKWASHSEVVRLIKTASDSLSLKLVTPMDRNYLKANASLDFSDGKISQGNGSPLHKNGSNQGSVSAASTTSSNGSTGASERTHSSAKRAPSWNPFKRHNTSRDSSTNRGSHSSNVIFR